VTLAAAPRAVVAASGAGRERFADIDVGALAWVALVALLLTMLAVDLLRHRGDREPTIGVALRESLVWIACGVAFSGVVAWAFGAQAFGEYVSGYLIEKSLSVDNVFVWALLFTTMAIPLRFQHRVLFWGIFGALTLRAAFIFAGTALISRFWWLLVVFGVFLVYTGVKVIRHRADEGGPEATRGLGVLRRFVPVSSEFDGHRFLTKADGRRAATPLLAALVVIELSDVVFAVDSVPAILAVSHEPFLVFASNAFAILGLRALYFVLAGARERFHYLSHALGAILVFVGVKMAFAHWVHVDTYLSLGVIVAVLAAAVAFSTRRNRRADAAALAAAPSSPHRS
jgi:tellurite resistance protein TerC